MTSARGGVGLNARFVLVGAFLRVVMLFEAAAVDFLVAQRVCRFLRFEAGMRCRFLVLKCKVNIILSQIKIYRIDNSLCWTKKRVRLVRL